MRVFIAIEFDDVVKDFLAKVQLELRDYCTRGNFSRRENFHLTVRFIGEVDEALLPSLNAVVASVAKGTKIFPLELGEPGHFPKGNRSVVWNGIKPCSELYKIYQDVEKGLEKLGFAKETRGFNPHITLAREVPREEAIKAIAGLRAGSQIQQVKAISLMQSKREQERLVYRPLFRAQVES